jgi:hypothetical protein
MDRGRVWINAILHTLLLPPSTQMVALATPPPPSSKCSTACELSLCHLNTERPSGYRSHCSMRELGVRQTISSGRFWKDGIRIYQTVISTTTSLTKLVPVKRTEMEYLSYGQGVGPVWSRMCIGSIILSFVIFVEFSWVTIRWHKDGQNVFSLIIPGFALWVMGHRSVANSCWEKHGKAFTFRVAQRQWLQQNWGELCRCAVPTHSEILQKALEKKVRQLTENGFEPQFSPDISHLCKGRGVKIPSCLYE